MSPKSTKSHLFNPNFENGSGGLIQLQMILMASDKRVIPDIKIDSIRFFHKKEIKPKKKKKTVIDDWF